MYETDGLYQIDGNRIVRFRATVDAITGSASNVAAVPVDVVSLSDLRSSKSSVDQLFAEALQGHLDKIGRAQILAIHATKVILAPDVDLAGRVWQRHLPLWIPAESVPDDWQISEWEQARPRR